MPISLLLNTYVICTPRNLHVSSNRSSSWARETNNVPPPKETKEIMLHVKIAPLSGNEALIVHPYC